MDGFAICAKGVDLFGSGTSQTVMFADSVQAAIDEWEILEEQGCDGLDPLPAEFDVYKLVKVEENGNN